MTQNKGFKRRVRARASHTGESYQAARHRLVTSACFSFAGIDPMPPSAETRSE